MPELESNLNKKASTIFLNSLTLMNKWPLTSFIMDKDEISFT